MLYRRDMYGAWMQSDGTIIECSREQSHRMVGDPTTLLCAGWIRMVYGSSACLEAVGYSISDPEVVGAVGWLWDRDETAVVLMDLNGESYRQTRKGGKWKEVR